MSDRVGTVRMANRPILRLPDSRSTHRKTGSPDRSPKPRGPGFHQQGERFRPEFERLESILAHGNATVELRQDPFGIAPERALVFVTAVPINDFARATQLVGLEILSEIALATDHELPDDLIVEHPDAVSPTLYATMPTQDAFNRLLRLWRRYQSGNESERGYAPWWHLFNMLAELRPWGPEDRLSADNRIELENRLPFDNDAEVQIELEHWPTQDTKKLGQWRQETKAKIVDLGGRIIDQSAIHERRFSYDAMLVSFTAGTVRAMLDDPSAPEGLAMLDGLQFILPQTIAQTLPAHSRPTATAQYDFDGFDATSPFRALLLDGTPIAAHRCLDGGVVIEDIHDLADRSVVSTRRHATEMASLILRGDLYSDGQPVLDSRILAIPLLVDTEDRSSSPVDRLFVDLVHTALQRAFYGNEPLAPDAFVVNFSIAVHGSHFAGRISSLARLLDWWSSQAGILFVVSAGNIEQPLQIPDMSIGKFEGLSLPERRDLVHTAQQRHRYKRTLLAPGEALNVLTVGAASLDLVSSDTEPTPGTVEIRSETNILPAISSGLGLGPFRTVKPDLIGIGGYHEVRGEPAGNDLRLRVVSRSNRTGLTVATASPTSPGTLSSRSRGTSCAAALVTRSLLNAAAALTGEGGPYEGVELPRIDLALLTRALAINAARWPDDARKIYDAKKRSYSIRAAEEVIRHFGYGAYV